MRESENDLLKPYGKAIRLVIGLFCTETFDYNSLILGKIKTNYNLEPHEIKKLNVKGKLEVLKQDGSTTIVPLAELETCVRNGCHSARISLQCCWDISAGSKGSPPGLQLLIVRTPTRKGFVDSAVQNRKVDVIQGIDSATIEKLALAKIQKNSKK